MATAQDRNIVLVLLDDVGVERVACYGLAADPPATPTFDRLAAMGVRFTRAWAQPYCSPSRAALLTGRYGYRTGLGKNIVHGQAARGLELEEWTLPEVLRAGSKGRIRTAACGKWHLASFEQGDDHPRDQGFEHASLTMGNPLTYNGFTKIVDGDEVRIQVYATIDTVNDALAWISTVGEEPWFLYLPLHAAHAPFHEPPASLHNQELDSDAARHKAAIEAADHEVGRLLATLDPAVRALTTVIVLGDNGTPRPAVEPPFVPSHGKGTLFEGSLNIPLIVAGAGVQAEGAVCDALVSTVDLLPTVAELFGMDAHEVLPADRPMDGRSLMGLLNDPSSEGPRDLLYAERFEPNHVVDKKRWWVAVRGKRFKLQQNVLTGRDRFFDLVDDPHEQRDLMGEDELSDEARSAHLRLVAAIKEITKT